MKKIWSPTLDVHNIVQHFTFEQITHTATATQVLLLVLVVKIFVSGLPSTPPTPWFPPRLLKWVT